jgi:VanZ family protein
MLRWKIFRSRWTAAAWLLVISFLFMLPGSALPNQTWLSRIHFDKWIHIGFFALLLFLWRSALGRGKNSWLLAGGLAYGIIVEFAQEHWVPNRSFDLYDIMADFVGSLLGLWVGEQVYKKNKPL